MFLEWFWVRHSFCVPQPWMDLERYYENQENVTENEPPIHASTLFTHYLKNIRSNLPWYNFNNILLSNSGGIEGVFLSLILVMWGVGITTLNNLTKIRGSGFLLIFSLGFPNLGFIMYIKINTYVVDVTIDDVLFNDIDIETQTLRSNGIPCNGLKKKGYIFLSILIRGCCISNDFVVDLIARIGIIQLYFQDLLGFLFFLVLLVFKSMICHSCTISRHFH